MGKMQLERYKKTEASMKASGRLSEIPAMENPRLKLEPCPA